MPTERPRIQVTLDDDTNGLLSALANKQNRSVSALAADLIRKALELQEDLFFSELTNQRISEDNGKYYTHEEAWDQVF